MRTDVLVVGGGPAGSMTAYELSRRGHSVVVVEEHPRVGHPVQCAGLVSRRVLELAGSERFVLGPIRGATLFSPSLRPLSFRAPEARGYVIDRAGLDIALADRASDAGASYRTGLRFDRFEDGPSGARRALLTEAGRGRTELDARVVIGADGVSSAVARAGRLRRRVEILPAFEAQVPLAPTDAEEVEVYLGNEIAPGLFGWSIPDLSGGARIGVAARADGVSALERYRRLVRLIERRLGRPLPSPVAYVVSGIPIGTVPRLAADRLVLVGDAAAQVKPLSGGGIFTGMRGASIAAEVVHRALESDRLDARELGRYQAAYDSELGPELRRALYLRRLFVRLTDAELERLVEALQGAGMSQAIVAFGDIDFPTHVARRLLRGSPALVQLFPKALAAWFNFGGGLAPDLEEGPRPRSAR